MYIMYSKEGQCVRVENEKGTYVILSGELGAVTSFQPVMFKGSLVNKLDAWLYDLYLVKVKTNPVGTYPRNVYRWLQMKSTGKVYKVWGLNNREANTSKLVQSDKIMIKGLGSFDYEDFLEFNFD